LPSYKLPADWHTLIVAEGAFLTLPGIYQWEIEKPEGVACYIGKYTRQSRPLRAYRRNVERLIGGLPYRKGAPDGFRLIHHELARAVQDRQRITLTILENPPTSDIWRREAEIIRERGTLNGPHQSRR
jgi:hypothetical protein